MSAASHRWNSSRSERVQ